MTDGILAGKTALIFGVANHRSIAWAIAQALAGAGATVGFTYQGERIEGTVRELAATVDSPLVTSCDVTKDEYLDRVFAEAERELGGLDILVHSVAFTPRETFEGRFLDVKRADFALTLDISAYSLTAMVQRAEPLMEKRGGGSIITMTYLAGERAVPKYNVMGVAKAALDASVRYLAMDLGEKKIRVNAISAGPLRTLAARAIAGFNLLEDHYEKRAPMRRTVEPSEVAQTALFLCSPMSTGITGEIIHVDGGYHAVGV
jgi:enoyl-[acyl-carrier protein] reductase I